LIRLMNHNLPSYIHNQPSAPEQLELAVMEDW